MTQQESLKDYLSDKLREVEMTLTQDEIDAIADRESRIAQAKIDFADDPYYLERQIRLINKAFEITMRSNTVLLDNFKARVAELIKS